VVAIAPIFIMLLYISFIFSLLTDLHARLDGKREAEKLFKIEQTLVVWRQATKDLVRAKNLFLQLMMMEKIAKF